MLDVHSHFLPKMDDGAKTEEESLQMLRAAKQQGVDTIISTSHFYADKESPDKFLRRRAHAFKKIEPLLGADTPNILFGSEVLFFPGISHADSVASLAIEGTNLILIEMPFQKWSDKTLDELISFRYTTGLSIILAHIERYEPIQSRKMLQTALDQDFYIQCNAEAFTSFHTRRFAFKLLDSGNLHFIGSDCHNTDDRPPNMEKAKDVFIKKRGEDEWTAFCENSERILNRHKLRSRSDTDHTV